jgi:hypothetical protein
MNINIMMMKHIKSYKIFENINKMIETYGEIIHKINDDINFIKEKCLEIEDMGYHVSVNYTPITLAKAEYPYIDTKLDSPEFYLDIKKNDSMYDFYGQLGERRVIINSIIEDVLFYMSQEGYKILERFNRGSEISKTDPKNFKFINNPTFYQIVFTI